MFGADTSFQRFTILLSRVTMPYGGDLVAGLTNLLYEVEMPQLTIQPATRPLRKLRLQSVPHAEILNSYHLLMRVRVYINQVELTQLFGPLTEIIP